MTHTNFYIPSLSIKNTVLIDLLNKINLFISYLINCIVNLDLNLRPFLDEYFISITIIGIVLSVLIIGRFLIIFMAGKIGKEILQVAANVAGIVATGILISDKVGGSGSNSNDKDKNKKEIKKDSSNDTKDTSTTKKTSS